MHCICNCIQVSFVVLLAAVVLKGDAVADTREVTITLQGQIVPKCGVSGAAGQLDFGPLGMGGARQERALAFTINCNTPFTYGMSSASGEMRHQGGAAAVAGGLTGRFPYQVLVTIPTDDGGTLRKSCDSAQLARPPGPLGGCVADSGEATATSKTAALTVSWTAGGLLLAGSYTDELFIRVGAKY